jgi:hypothetical protein
MPSVFYFKRNLKFNVKKFLTEPTVNWGNSEKRVDEIGCKGGRSVMLAAFKMMYYLGFRNIYLLGADFKMEKGKDNYAFPQNRTDNLIRGNNQTYQDLNKRFVALLPEFYEKGLKVYNCNKDSNLTSFPYMSYENAVKNATEPFNKTIDTLGWYDQYEKDKEKEEKEEKNIERSIVKQPVMSLRKRKI